MESDILRVATLLLVSVAMGLALAHALEFPGKIRLDRHAYYAMQPIYYPGFTIGGGIGEAGGILATAALLFLTPPGTVDFWLALVALLGLVAMQAVYWLVTHPVNKFWVEGTNLSRFSAGFFSFGARKPVSGGGQREWTELRDRWEYSHVARAGFGLLSFVALAVASAR
jgi:hypothetical protein